MRLMNPRTLVRDLAGAITAKDYFARKSDGTLYVYRGRVYRPDGEQLVRQRVKHLLLDEDCSEMWSRALSNEILEFISLDLPELWVQPSHELINLENGVFRVKTRELLPHSPEFLSAIRIPIAYDSEAPCPEIDKFISEVFPEDAIPLAWEILGDMLTPDRSVQKAICLMGEGGNGKSVFLDLATRFVGEENVCHLSLQRLESDRFSAARLYGKLANICPDLPGERLSSSAMFKAITGCDRITAEIKYRDSFEFTPFTRLVFSANKLPATEDASQAFFDRWLIVPFPNRFRQTRRETPHRTLQARLCGQSEMSGALNKPLEGLERVRKRGWFTEPRASRELVRRYQASNDALAAWLDEHTVAGPEVMISQSELHGAYATHCRRSSQSPASKQIFGRRLRTLRPNVEPTQRTLCGRRTWVYAGIALRENPAGDRSL
jgi:P4 family phage/plasmid primase-like protien